MSGHNEQDLFVTDLPGTGETGTDETRIEQAVRTTLERHATRIPLQDPPVAQLLDRGRSHRRRRDAVRVAAVLVTVAAGVVGGYAARVGAPGAPGTATSQVVSTAARPSSTASVSTDSYHATVPKNWKPGAKLPLNTYSSVPNWVQAKDAATELGSDKKEGHHVNLGVSPTPTMCLTLGSSPIAWPKGFYAEGTPLVVFDPEGRPVYVVDQGFTGVDGPSELGYGDGAHLLPGLDLAHCAAQAASGLQPYTLAMIFPGTPGR